MVVSLSLSIDGNAPRMSPDVAINPDEVNRIPNQSLGFTSRVRRGF